MSDTAFAAAGRRKRINILKKLIVIFMLVIILIPTAFSIYLVNELGGVREQLLLLSGRLLAVEEAVYAPLDAAHDDRERIDGSIFYTATPYLSEKEQTQIREQTKEAPAKKRFYLTFDDGPSRNTERILDILADYDVKATFFVVGKTDAAAAATYRRIVAEGHTLGLHSYSHRYHEIYRSLEAFSADLGRLQELLYEETGVWSRYYRFPGGSSTTTGRSDMQEFINYLTENDIYYYDWNIASGDAASGGISTQRIINNCLSGINTQDGGIILMHDTADKNTTVAALPAIIEGILADEDNLLLPIDDDTPLLQHIKAGSDIPD